MMRSPLWTTLLVAFGLACIVGSVRPELVLPVVAGALGGGLSWWVGFQQGRRRGWFEAEHAQARRMLEGFAHFAERVLAEAPEDLPEDLEQARDDLQRRYQQAQKLLANDGKPRREAGLGDSGSS